VLRAGSALLDSRGRVYGPPLPQEDSAKQLAEEAKGNSSGAEARLMAKDFLSELKLRPPVPSSFARKL